MEQKFENWDWILWAFLSIAFMAQLSEQLGRFGAFPAGLGDESLQSRVGSAEKTSIIIIAELGDVRPGKQLAQGVVAHLADVIEADDLLRADAGWQERDEPLSGLVVVRQFGEVGVWDIGSPVG